MALKSLADLINGMKVFISIFLLVTVLQSKAQQITGLWFSADSSRIYKINQTGSNLYEAVIKTSARKTDSIGFTVIKNLHYSTAKKRYEGIMYAVTDNRPCFVKIKMTDNRLHLKLNRMFLFNAVLIWSRATDDTAAAAN